MNALEHVIAWWPIIVMTVPTVAVLASIFVGVPIAESDNDPWMLAITAFWGGVIVLGFWALSIIIAGFIDGWGWAVSLV